MINIFGNGAIPPSGTPLRIEVTTTNDAEELAKARVRHTQFQCNSNWLQTHAAQVYRHRGKHFCIAGMQLFLADTAEEAWALGRAAHPNDGGMFFRYIPLENMPRI